jgi:hypothetical protein
VFPGAAAIGLVTGSAFGAVTALLLRWLDGP